MCWRGGDNKGVNCYKMYCIHFVWIVIWTNHEKREGIWMWLWEDIKQLLNLLRVMSVLWLWVVVLVVVVSVLIWTLWLRSYAVWVSFKVLQRQSTGEVTLETRSAKCWKFLELDAWGPLMLFSLALFMFENSIVNFSKNEMGFEGKRVIVLSPKGLVN